MQQACGWRARRGDKLGARRCCGQIGCTTEGAHLARSLDSTPAGDLHHARNVCHPPCNSAKGAVRAFCDDRSDKTQGSGQMDASTLGLQPAQRRSTPGSRPSRFRKRPRRHIGISGHCLVLRRPAPGGRPSHFWRWPRNRIGARCVDPSNGAGGPRRESRRSRTR